MNRCSNCNCELPDGAKFCPECGAPFTPEEESVVDTPVSDIPEKNICEKCGLELPAGAKFCSVCGGKAIVGTSLVVPTKPAVGTVAASTGGMMEAVSVEALEQPADPVPSVIDMSDDFSPEIGAIPEATVAPEASVAPETTVASMASVIPETTAASMAAVSPMASVIPETTAAPGMSLSSVNASPASPVNTVPQPVNSISQPVSTISQPISASQPVSASPIFPPVSGTGTATMVNPAPAANGAFGAPVSNTLNASPAANGAPLSGSTGFADFNAGTPAIDYSKMKPVKKMGMGAKIGIIAGSLVGAVAVAAGVFFATNKATFLSTILGKEKYAVMVESSAIKSVAEKIDASAIADGVEAASSLYASMADSMNGAGAIGGMGDIADMGLYSGSTAKPAAVPMMMNPYVGMNGFDAAEYVKMLNEQFMKSYGVNSANMKMSMNVEFGNTVKELAGTAPMDDIQELINSTEVTYDIVAGETAADITANVKLDDTTVDCKVLLTGNNEMYMTLPFVSEKAFRIRLDPPVGEQEEAKAVSLQLDKAELERIIGKAFETYLMNYKDAAIEMEKGSLSIAGVNVAGKQIVAEFKGNSLSKLVEDIANVILKDEYLSGKLIEFCNDMGSEMTREDYDKAVLEALDLEVTDSDKLIITTIIDKNGKVLAKSLKFVDDEEEAVIAYTIQEKTAAVEIISDDENKLAIKTDIISEQDFEANIEFVSDGDKMSFKVKCMGVKTEQFCGKPALVGTVVFSMNMPEEFEDQLGKDAFAAINNMAITLSSSVSGSTANSMVKVDAGNYGSYAMNCVLAVKDGQTSEIPAEAIDLTSVMKDGMPDDTTRGKLKEYMDEFGKVYDEELMPFFEKYESIFGEMPEFTNPFDQKPGQGGEMTKEELINYVNADIMALGTLSQGETALDADMSKRVNELSSKYTMLYAILSTLDEDAEGYAQTLAAAEEEYWDLYDELVAVQTALEGGNASEPVKPDELYPEVDVKGLSKMDYTELEKIMNDYNAVFETLKGVYESSASAGDKELKELFDEADYACIDVEHDWDYFYDSLKRGTLSINLLNSLRSSLKEYIPAVQELADAMDDRGMLD